MDLTNEEKYIVSERSVGRTQYLWPVPQSIFRFEWFNFLQYGKPNHDKIYISSSGRLCTSKTRHFRQRHQNELISTKFYLGVFFLISIVKSLVTTDATARP